MSNGSQTIHTSKTCHPPRIPLRYTRYPDSLRMLSYGRIAVLSFLFRALYIKEPVSTHLLLEKHWEQLLLIVPYEDRNCLSSILWCISSIPVSKHAVVRTLQSQHFQSRVHQLQIFTLPPSSVPTDFSFSSRDFLPGLTWRVGQLWVAPRYQDIRQNSSYQ